MCITRGWLAWIVVLTACAGPGGAMRPKATPLAGGRPLLAGWGAATTLEDDEPQGPPLGEVSASQREAECRLAVAHLWRILAPIDAIGAEVEVTYWAHRGALTMLSWRRVAEGAGHGEAVDERAFTEKLWRPLLAYVGEAPRTLRLVQRREKGRWMLQSLHSSDDGMAQPPLEAKTLPVDVPGIAAGSFGALEREARTRWLPLLKAPADGGARLELRVEFEDERLMGSSPTRYEMNGRGVSIGPPPAFEVQLAGALAPFTQGLGRRAVRLVLATERAGGGASPRWRVKGAAAERTKAVQTPESFTTHTEYRLLHEEILRRWREDVHGTAVLAATFTAEQVALWIAGGWAARGVGKVLEFAAGPLVRVLGRGSTEAAGWLASLVRRLPEAEREALARLWSRAEVQGVEVLAASERTELRSALLRLERLAVTPITDREKKGLRKEARKLLKAHLAKLDAALPSRLVNDLQQPYPIHHRFPLEYAHLAPERHINAIDNLAAVCPDVHDSMGKIWTAFRTGGVEVTPEAVNRVVTPVDQSYGRWYNAVYVPAAEQAALQAAERRALQRLRDLLPSLKAIPNP